MAISSLVRPSTRSYAVITKPPPPLEPPIMPTVLDSQPPASLPKHLPIATTPASWKGYRKFLKQKDEHAAELHRRLEATLLENERMRSFMEIRAPMKDDFAFRTVSCHLLLMLHLVMISWPASIKDLAAFAAHWTSLGFNRR